MFDLSVLDDVVAGRDAVEWFTDAPCTDGGVSLPCDIYVESVDGQVAHGWRIEPLRPDEDRRVRRLRRDDVVTLFVEESPETVLLLPSLDVHIVDGDSPSVVVVPAGTTPDPHQASRLQRPGTYRVANGVTPQAISDALALWSAGLAESETSFSFRLPTLDEQAAAKSVEPDQDDDGADLYDEEIGELIADYESIAWFQAALTWTDSDGSHAFRDVVEVTFDDEGEQVWLVAIEPPDATETIGRPTPGGHRVGIDPTDPTRFTLPHDVVVFTLFRPDNGFEAAGWVVPLTDPPSAGLWQAIEDARRDHPDTELVHAPGWSEQAVNEALKAWAQAWTGEAIEFGFDAEDPDFLAAAERNGQIATMPPRVAGRGQAPARCMHRREPELPFEDPLVCGAPGTGYHTGDDGEVIVSCDDHAPATGVTALMRR